MDIYSYRTDSYRKMLDKLPPNLQQMARQTFEKWSQDPVTMTRQLNINPDVVSVKVGDGHRALGVKISPEKKTNTLSVVWFFIGKHSDYEHFMKASRLEMCLNQIRDRLPLYRERMQQRQGLVKKQKPSLTNV